MRDEIHVTVIEPMDTESSTHKDRTLASLPLQQRRFTVKCCMGHHLVWGLWWGYETQPTAPNIYFVIRTKLHMRPAAPSAVLAPPV